MNKSRCKISMNELLDSLSSKFKRNVNESKFFEKKHWEKINIDIFIEESFLINPLTTDNAIYLTR